MTAPSVLEKLTRVPLCRGLTPPEVEELLQLAEEVGARAGDSLFAEGAAGDAFYVVLEGVVEIRKRDRSGTSQLLASLGDGSVIGEMSLLQENAPRSAAAVAQTDLRLLRITAQRFEQLLRKDSVAALKIIHNLAQVLARRLLLMDEKLVDVLGKGTRREELADFQKLLTHWSF